MKRVFISCPMNGRTDEQINESMKRMHKFAEAVFGEELEIINSVIADNELPKMFEYWDVRHQRLWYLGESIKRMGRADFFIGINSNGHYPGCEIETKVAGLYNVPCATLYYDQIEHIMPDVYHKMLGIDEADF